MNGQKYANGHLWRVGGASKAIFSVAVGALLLATPIACSFVGSLQLLVLGFLFMVGVAALLLGTVMSRRNRRVRMTD